ncbi:hypothetical protein ACFSM5_18385 [Lacibacterium aquatile]|uniref:Capsular polysaccharide transport system permease protein n=1 Tax=Lacibacterium aquatile TaxID=1168082 RepID=A0ABW5DWL1_9PROT
MAGKKETSFLLKPKVWFAFLLVFLPTILCAFYYTLVASDIYVSETRFAVRTLGGGGGESSPAKVSIQAVISDTIGVVDYLSSLDAMKAVDAKHDLRKIYQDPSADFWVRLRKNASQEQMLEYYRRRLEVSVDNISGIITLKVQAFHPETAKQIADTLVSLSEGLVNKFSQRVTADYRALAGAEIALAEKQLTEARLALTRYREEQRTLDTTESSKAVMDIVGRMRADLAKVEADMRANAAFLRPDNPRMFALRTQAAALRDQIDRESTRVGGEQDKLAQIVGEFERLEISRSFAEKRYGFALEAAESARAEAMRQHSYLVSIVRAQVAEEALYPRRLLIIVTVLVASLMIYAIGSLVVVGIRDHFI